MLTHAAVVLLPFVAPTLRHKIRCKSEFLDQLGSETEIRDSVPLPAAAMYCSVLYYFMQCDYHGEVSSR